VDVRKRHIVHVKRRKRRELSQFQDLFLSLKHLVNRLVEQPEKSLRDTLKKSLFVKLIMVIINLESQMNVSLLA